MYPIHVVPSNAPFVCLYWGDPFDGDEAVYLNTYWNRQEADMVAARIQAARPGETVDILHGWSITLPGGNHAGQR